MLIIPNTDQIYREVFSSELGTICNDCEVREISAPREVPRPDHKKRKKGKKKGGKSFSQTPLHKEPLPTLCLCLFNTALSYILYPLIPTSRKFSPSPPPQKKTENEVFSQTIGCSSFMKFIFYACVYLPCFLCPC